MMCMYLYDDSISHRGWKVVLPANNPLSPRFVFLAYVKVLNIPGHDLESFEKMLASMSSASSFKLSLDIMV